MKLRWLAPLLLVVGCTTSPTENTEVSIQDPCMTQCTSLFNRCVEESGGDASACNPDRAECEQECRADSAEGDTEEDGVITNE